MEKRRIKEQLRQSVGGGMYINLTELQRFFASGKAFTRSIVNGLPFLLNGNEKKYNIDDVVQRIWDRQ